MGKSTKRAKKSNEKEMPLDNKTNLSSWGGKISGQDAASYINDLALEMKTLAESAKLSFLAYLIELVIEESAVQKRRRL